MKITAEEVKKVALLSRLSFTDKEIEELEDSMSGILTYMEELNQYDTENVAPMAHAVEQFMLCVKISRIHLLLTNRL